jgi:hypothetical protein
VVKLRNLQPDVGFLNCLVIQKLSDLEGVKSFDDFSKDQKVFVLPLTTAITGIKYPEGKYSFNDLLV